jgi:PKHD-type hydroxylase
MPSRLGVLSIYKLGFRACNPLPETCSANAYLGRYVALPDFLSPAECQWLIDSEGDFNQAKVVNPRIGDNQLSLKERQTDTKSILDKPETQWIYQRLRQNLNKLNQDCFRFELTRFSLPEVLKYEVGGFYSPHTDLGVGEISTRKLSVVAMLSDPSTYTGGELVFYPRFTPCPRTQGSLFLFPSYLLHEVRAITQGVRYTLVTWVHGPCFR